MQLISSRVPCPRLTVLQRRGAVNAAPAQDVPSLLAGFLPLLLLCGTKDSALEPQPSTPSPAVAGQGVGYGQAQEAGVRSPAGRKETLQISFNLQKHLGEERQLFPFLHMGTLREVKGPVQSHKSGRS